jgi:hypothetical protein
MNGVAERRRRVGFQTRSRTSSNFGSHCIGPPQRLTQAVTAADKPPRTRAPRIGRVTGAGRSPGSRVVARLRLPGLAPSGIWRGLPAYSCGGSRGFGPEFSALPRSQRVRPLVTGPPAPPTIERWNRGRVKSVYDIKISLYLYNADQVDYLKTPSLRRSNREAR